MTAAEVKMEHVKKTAKSLRRPIDLDSSDEDQDVNSPTVTIPATGLEIQNTYRKWGAIKMESKTISLGEEEEPEDFLAAEAPSVADIKDEKSEMKDDFEDNAEVMKFEAEQKGAALAAEMTFEKDLNETDKLFKEAAATGDFSMQGRLGARFKRSSAFAEYAELKGELGKVAGINQLRKQLRDKWAKQQWQQIKTTRRKMTRSSEVNVELGMWLPIPRVIKEEGGFKSRAAVKAGLNYVRKAVAMGPSWAMVNSMTEALEVYYIRKERRFEHEKACFLDESAEAKPIEKEEEIEPVQKEQPAKNEKLQKARSENQLEHGLQTPIVTRKRIANAEPAETPTAKVPRATKAGQQAKDGLEKVKLATERKTLWSKLVPEAQTKLDCIKPEVLELISKAVVDNLTNALKAISDYAKANDFAAIFLCHDVKTARKKIGATFEEKSSIFQKQFGQKLDLVSKWYEVLLRQLDSIA